MPDTANNAVVAPAPTLGRLIDAAWEVREKKRAVQAQLDSLDAEIAKIEGTILARLDAEEVDTGRGKKASVSISESTVFSISDFDVFTKYVKKSGYFHLFQRRVTDLAAREIFQSKGKVPGLTPFTRRRVNLRSL
jgi:hypothetical protein